MKNIHEIERLIVDYKESMARNATNRVLDYVYTMYTAGYFTREEYQYFCKACQDAEFGN